MRVLVIGATGTIGSTIVKALSARHEVVTASYKQSAVVVVSAAGMRGSPA